MRIATQTLVVSPRVLPILAMMTAFAAPAAAASVYNEGSQGDLSNSGAAPTSLTFSLGSNQVLGVTGRSTAVDRDYFTFTVPVGLQLSSIIELPGTTAIGPVSFIGLEAGNQVTLPTGATTAVGLLGWWHFAASDVNSDILASMAIPSEGSSGFTPPLGPGAYSVWIQDFGAGTSPYGFNFVLSTPEPATIFTSALAIAGLYLLRTRRRGAAPDVEQRQ
jgi:hypothetical protein